MSNQVAARLKGDDYQLVFFWLQAARLFHSKLFEAVSLERDDIDGVDDVGVTYGEPGLDEDGRKIRDDYFQLKYHVDHNGAYSWDYLIKRKTDRSTSLLQKFYHAYLSRKNSEYAFRLTLVSNWQWRDDDKLAKSIRTDPNTLPKEFFDTKPERVYREARALWASHLEITDAELLEFASHLRFKLNFLSHASLSEWVNAELARAGLEPMDFSRESNPYLDLARSYIKAGRKLFTVDELRQSCANEGLLASLPATDAPLRLGIRSRMRGAENMKPETNRMLCLCEHFEDRFIRDPELWVSKVYPQLETFLQPKDLRQVEHHLLLDCHLSLAYACGFLLEPTSGAQVFPFQKGNPPTVWRPEADNKYPDVQSLDHELVDWAGEGDDLAVSVSLTHPIRSDVETYLSTAALPVKALLAVSLGEKPSWQSVKGAPHAIWLAGELQQLIRATRQKHKTRTTHLFVSGPNGFMYFLGQAGKFLNPMQLYEHDPEGLRGGGYLPSLRLPVLPRELETINTSKELA